MKSEFKIVKREVEKQNKNSKWHDKSYHFSSTLKYILINIKQRYMILISLEILVFKRDPEHFTASEVGLDIGILLKGIFRHQCFSCLTNIRPINTRVCTAACVSWLTTTCDSHMEHHANVSDNDVLLFTCWLNFLKTPFVSI